MKKSPRFPRLTPLRAFELLRELDEQAGFTRGRGLSETCASGRARREIADHVRAALTKVRR